MKRLPILYPILLAVYPVLFLYSTNMDQTDFRIAVGPLLAAPVGAALVWLLTGRLLRDRARGAVLAAAFVAIFFAYGHVHAFLHKFLLKRDFEATIPLLGELWVFESVVHLVTSAAALAALYRLYRWLARGGDVSSWAGPLNGVSAVLCILPLITIATSEEKAATDRDPALGVLPDLVYRADLKRPDPSTLPDVYFFMMDGYARQDTFQRHYGFDNEEFLGFLKAKGFDIAPQSRSNHYWTFLSLASMLNMDYLTPLTEKLGRTTKSRSLPYEMIRNNRVARFLRNQGYTTVHYDSTWGATLRNRYANIEVSCNAEGVFQEEFHRVLAEVSWLRLLVPSVGQDLASCWLHHFAELEKESARPGPKFVFAHFLMPHHPYLFDAEGKVLRNAQVSNQFEFQKNLWARKDLYVGQTKYVNQRLTTIIERLLKESKRPPVIVLLSDHGPHVSRTKGLYRKQQRVSNLTAVLVPGAANLLPPDVSAVNVFRLVLNRMFDAGFARLPDHSYYSNYNKPYIFTEISSDPVPPKMKDHTRRSSAAPLRSEKTH